MIVLENVNEGIVTAEEMERLAAAFIKALNIVELFKGTQADMLLQSVLETNHIGLDSEMEEFIAD
jgi:molybdenum cofactor biosynthesis enzyme